MGLLFQLTMKLSSWPLLPNSCVFVFPMTLDPVDGSADVTVASIDELLMPLYPVAACLVIPSSVGRITLKILAATPSSFQSQ